MIDKYIPTKDEFNPKNNIGLSIRFYKKSLKLMFLVLEKFKIWYKPRSKLYSKSSAIKYMSRDLSSQIVTRAYVLSILIVWDVDS